MLSSVTRRRISRQRSICLTPNFHCWTSRLRFSLNFTDSSHLFIARIYKKKKSAHVLVAVVSGVLVQGRIPHVPVHTGINPHGCFSRLGRRHQPASSPSSITVIIALHLLPFPVSNPHARPAPLSSPFCSFFSSHQSKRPVMDRLADGRPGAGFNVQWAV